MAIERGDESAGRGVARAGKGSLLGSLKDALRAAGREDHAAPLEQAAQGNPVGNPIVGVVVPMVQQAISKPDVVTMSAAEAARHARTVPVEKIIPRVEETVQVPFEPPATRVLRAERAPELHAAAPRTRLVRGRQQIVRDTFAQDPVVGFLIVVGGPGLGASRPIYEGNNTVGRSAANRIPLDFGDETISAEAQAYIRYDSTDRSFLFVPNLAKTNVVSVNEKRPAGAVELKAMDIVTFGRTQVAFLPFCGPEFDWSEISDAKEE